MMQTGELLTPSLDGQVKRPFSVMAMFCISILGGVFAIVLFSLFNMSRLGTLKRDWWVPLTALVLTVLSMFFWVHFQMAGKHFRYVGNALAFGYLAIFYLRNKAILNLEAALERKPAPALKIGIFCILIGICAVVVLYISVKHLYG